MLGGIGPSILLLHLEDLLLANKIKFLHLAQLLLDNGGTTIKSLKLLVHVLQLLQTLDSSSLRFTMSSFTIGGPSKEGQFLAHWSVGT